MHVTTGKQRLTVIYLANTLVAITLATQMGARTGVVPIVLLGVISPMLLALVFSGYEAGWRGIKRFLSGPLGFHFSALALVCAICLPPALMLLSLYIDTGRLPTPDIGIMLQKLPILLILMTGEEFGWRRYAFARLAEHCSFMVAALAVAGVWWLWHYPGYLIGMGTPEQMSFWLFGVMVIPGGVLLAFLYRWTRNVYLVIAAHVSSNLAFSGLPFLPEFTGDSTAFILYSGLLWLLVVPLLLQRKYWVKNYVSSS